MTKKGESPVPTGNEARLTGEAMETAAVVIPTLNEECSIGKVIDGVPVVDLLKNGSKAVYVIEGQSTDIAGRSPSKRAQ